MDIGRGDGDTARLLRCSWLSVTEYSLATIPSCSLGRSAGIQSQSHVAPVSSQSLESLVAAKWLPFQKELLALLMAFFLPQPCSKSESLPHAIPSRWPVLTLTWGPIATVSPFRVELLIEFCRGNNSSLTQEGPWGPGFWRLVCVLFGSARPEFCLSAAVSLWKSQHHLSDLLGFSFVESEVSSLLCSVLRKIQENECKSPVLYPHVESMPLPNLCCSGFYIICCCWG